MSLQILTDNNYENQCILPPIELNYKCIEIPQAFICIFEITHLQYNHYFLVLLLLFSLKAQLNAQRNTKRVKYYNLKSITSCRAIFAQEME